MPWLPLCLRQDQKLAACHPLLIPKGRRSRRSLSHLATPQASPQFPRAALLLLPLPTWAWFPDVPRALAGPAHGCQKRGFLENDHLCGLDLRVIWSGGAAGLEAEALVGTGTPLPRGSGKIVLCCRISLARSPQPATACGAREAFHRHRLSELHY